MDKKEKIKVAIAGCGKITRTRHAPEYNKNRNVEIVGFYDYNAERAEELAEEYGGRVYSSFEDMIADSDVDIVSVCTPNFLHATHSIAALKAGKDVLCEKPMAPNTQEAQQMIDAQKETGKILMLGHNQRLIPTHIRARELLAAGEIGTILSVQTNFKHRGPESWSVEKGNSWFFSKDKASFGVLGDLGSHKIDLIRYLLNEEIESIFADMNTLDKRFPDNSLIDLEDNAVCILKMQSGISGIMSVSWTNYGVEDNSTVIYGTKGTMKIFASEIDDIIIDLRDGTNVRHHVSAISTNTNQLNSGVIDAFVSSVLNKSEPSVTGIDGKNTLACLEAAKKSAETGTWQKTLC